MILLAFEREKLKNQMDGGAWGRVGKKGGGEREAFSVTGIVGPWMQKSPNC